MPYNTPQEETTLNPIYHIYFLFCDFAIFVRILFYEMPMAPFDHIGRAIYLLFNEPFIFYKYWFYFAHILQIGFRLNEYLRLLLSGEYSLKDALIIIHTRLKYRYTVNSWVVKGLIRLKMYPIMRQLPLFGFIVSNISKMSQMAITYCIGYLLSLIHPFVGKLVLVIFSFFGIGWLLGTLWTLIITYGVWRNIFGNWRRMYRGQQIIQIYESQRALLVGYKDNISEEAMHEIYNIAERERLTKIYQLPLSGIESVSKKHESLEPEDSDRAQNELENDEEVENSESDLESDSSEEIDSESQVKSNEISKSKLDSESIPVTLKNTEQKPLEQVKT